MAVFFRHTVGSQAQDLAEALALAGHLHGLHHSGGIAKAQRKADIGFGDGAHFIELHGAGHGGAHGDGVDAVLVAQEVCIAYGGQIAYAAIGPKGPSRLILGTLCPLT